MCLDLIGRNFGNVQNAKALSVYAMGCFSIFNRFTNQVDGVSAMNLSRRLAATDWSYRTTDFLAASYKSPIPGHGKVVLCIRLDVQCLLRPVGHRT
jgi:hypothetical protein